MLAVRSLEFVAAFNVFSAALCLAFVAVLAFVLVHRLAWLVLQG